MPKSRLRQECVSNGGRAKIERWFAARHRRAATTPTALVKARHNEEVRLHFWDVVLRVAPATNNTLEISGSKVV